VLSRELAVLKVSLEERLLEIRDLRRGESESGELRQQVDRLTFELVNVKAYYQQQIDREVVFEWKMRLLFIPLLLSLKKISVKTDSTSQSRL
jgi:hypothetical protein